jgi:hypothetical protein
MHTVLWVVLVLLAIGGAYVALPSLAHAYQRFRGPRVVTCPETKGIVDIELDALYAALTAAGGKAKLRVAHCERWPEYQPCPQSCLAGVDAAWAREHGLLTRPLAP